MSDALAKVTAIIEPEVEALGYRLVRVVMTGGRSDPTLQIMAERPDTRQLSLSDCERISRQISPLLDEADPIEEAYRLEVSSPGIDRPLTRLADYADWTGHEARITLAEPRAGRRQYSGTIAGVEGDSIRITGKDGADNDVPFAAIASAKLLLTDKLIASTAPLDAEGADLIKT